jgi:hypothetical protein
MYAHSCRHAPKHILSATFQPNVFEGTLVSAFFMNEIFFSLFHATRLSSARKPSQIREVEPQTDANIVYIHKNLTSTCTYRECQSITQWQLVWKSQPFCMHTHAHFEVNTQQTDTLVVYCAQLFLVSSMDNLEFNVNRQRPQCEVARACTHPHMHTHRHVNTY